MKLLGTPARKGSNTFLSEADHVAREGGDVSAEVDRLPVRRAKLRDLQRVTLFYASLPKLLFVLGELNSVGLRRDDETFSTVELVLRW